MQFLLSIIFITVTGLWAFSESLPFRQEVTIYTAFCNGELKDGKCKSTEHTLSNHTYKPMVDKQVVVHWRDNWAPERYDQCVVRDVKIGHARRVLVVRK